MKEKLGLSGQRPAIVLAEDAGHQPRMVTFEQPDGSSESFSYQDLRSVRYDPAGLIRLRFAADNIVLHGRNLLSVWSALRSRRVRLFRVRGTEATTGPEPHIDSITITPASRRESSAGSPLPGSLFKRRFPVPIVSAPRRDS